MNLETKDLPPTEYAHKRYEIQLNGIAVFILGVHHFSLWNGVIYVTLEPLPELYNLTAKQLRFLKRQFDELTGYTYFCQIEPGNKKNARFAEFFGFRYDSSCYDRDTYIRDDLKWPK